MKIKKTNAARYLDELGISYELRRIAVPALILQPLVENAVKHGISENKKGGTIRITACHGEIGGRPSLKLTVRDTGAGGGADE